MSCLFLPGGAQWLAGHFWVENTYRGRPHTAVELGLGRRARRWRLNPLKGLLRRRPATHLAVVVVEFCETQRREWAIAPRHIRQEGLSEYRTAAALARPLFDKPTYSHAASTPTYQAQGTIRRDNFR